MNNNEQIAQIDALYQQFQAQIKSGTNLQIVVEAAKLLLANAVVQSPEDIQKILCASFSPDISGMVANIKKAQKLMQQ